jgi:hypothetical protein
VTGTVTVYAANPLDTLNEAPLTTLTATNPGHQSAGRHRDPPGAVRPARRRRVSRTFALARLVQCRLFVPR